MAHRHLRGNCRDLANLDDTQLACRLLILSYSWEWFLAEKYTDLLFLVHTLVANDITDSPLRQFMCSSRTTDILYARGVVFIVVNWLITCGPSYGRNARSSAEVCINS